MPLPLPVRRRKQVAAIEKARRVMLQNRKLAQKAKMETKAKEKAKAKAKGKAATTASTRSSSEMDKAKAKAKAKAKERAAQGKAKAKAKPEQSGKKRQAPDAKSSKPPPAYPRYVETPQQKVKRYFEKFVGDARGYFERQGRGVLLFEPLLRGNWGAAREADYPGTTPEERPQVLHMPTVLNEADFGADAIMKKDHMLLPLPLLKEAVRVHAWLREGLHSVGSVKWKVASMWRDYLNPLLSKSASFIQAGDNRGAFALLLGLVIFARREENWIPYRHDLVEWNEFCNYWKALGAVWKELLKASDQGLGITALRRGLYRSPCRSYRRRLVEMVEDFERRTNQALKPVARQALIRSQLQSAGAGVTSSSSASSTVPVQQLRFKIFEDKKSSAKK
mmetsp:Transcript_96254/g.201095  ORF Transcript_96254/g.201095 Transcript_96254/m.201095 type:complete len:392 (-) Transcript_96254:364-1539(-)